MKTHVAFLRGINVGGRNPVGMDTLRKAFEKLGFQNVRSILASGNVLFETSETASSSLVRKLETKLEATFALRIGIMVRSIDDLKRLEKSKPFAKIKATPQTRLYVTFLSEKPGNQPSPSLASKDQGFEILRVSDSEVCSRLTLSPGAQTPKLMAWLEKSFGKNITTRNWNTIGRILLAHNQSTGMQSK